jgi:hypothetical protein
MNFDLAGDTQSIGTFAIAAAPINRLRHLSNFLPGRQVQFSDLIRPYPALQILAAHSGNSPPPPAVQYLCRKILQSGCPVLIMGFGGQKLGVPLLGPKKRFLTTKFRFL